MDTESPDLFRDAPAQEWLGSKIEHLSGLHILSGYILDALPTELRDAMQRPEGYTDLAERQSRILEASAPAIFSNLDPYKAKLAQLDLLFMLGGYIPAGKNALNLAPAQLLGLINYQAQRFDLPDRMTYELLIDVNTDEFMRTGRIRLFSDGAEANAERDFYIGHYYAEPHAKSATWQLRELLENPRADNIDTTLESARMHVERFSKDVLSYARLPRDAFAYFRQFLGSYPDGRRNASGAFMATPQLLELSLHPPTEQQKNFLEESLPYYPIWAQPLIVAWTQESAAGNNILDAIKNDRLTLTENQQATLIKLMEHFRDFKHSHLGITHHQIPHAFPERGAGLVLSREGLKDFGERDVFDPSLPPGTGGFDVQNVLGNGVYRLEKLLGELSPSERQRTADPAAHEIIVQRTRSWPKIFRRLGKVSVILASIAVL